MPTEPFWGYEVLSESKTAEIEPKHAILQKFLHAQAVLCPKNQNLAHGAFWHTVSILRYLKLSKETKNQGAFDENPYF